MSKDNNDIELENNDSNKNENKSVSVDDNQDFYTGYSPLDEPVKERAYTSSNIDASNLESELEEPTFNAPNFDDFEPDSEPNSFNPAVENLDKKEQLYATEQMVDTVLDVYDKAHVLANRAVKINTDKIAKSMEDGDINPQLQVPIDDTGNTLRLLQYVEEYNNQLSDAISLDEEFIQKVRPAMIRVFQKRGIAMTDEQYLGVAFGTDIVTKTAMIYQLVKQNNKLFDMWKEQSSSTPKQPQTKKTTSTPTPSSTPPTKPQASTQQTQIVAVGEEDNSNTKNKIFEEPEEFTAKSMVNDMIGEFDTNKGFKNSKQSDNMPQFGDPEILRELDKLSKEDKVIDIAETKPKRKRGRPKKKK